MADGRFDDDLSKLAPEDLRRVCRWVEDRMINAVTPLDMELQRQVPGMMAADVVYQRARRAVDRVVQIVGEVRALARGDDGRRTTDDGRMVRPPSVAPWKKSLANLRRRPDNFPTT